MTIETLLQQASAAEKKIFETLRTTILSVQDDVVEDIYGKKVITVLYGRENSKRVFSGLQLGKGFVKLFIHHTDTINTSNFKLEGAGKHARHIKFSDADQLNAQDLETMFHESYALS